MKSIPLAISLIFLTTGIALADPLYGVAPPDSPPSSSSNADNGATPQNPSQTPQAYPNGPSNPSGGPNSLSPTVNNTANPTNDAPTFMNGSIPNTPNPLMPNTVSPGSYSYPLTNLYEQAGFPSLAAPLMSAVFQPFGLTLLQPNPFQIVPQGLFSFSGTLEGDTNINYSPNQPEDGYLYSVIPALAYSDFNDYGYISAMASASLYDYPGENIPAYFTEMGSLSAGTYLGSRIYVGVQDLVTQGSIMQQNGTPLGFLNGIDPYMNNIADAEIGVALTPYITFVQSAIDNYFDGTSFGAGIMNFQSVMETINYRDQRNYLTGTYTYSQGVFSLFPGFISNGMSFTGSHFLSPTTSIGPGGMYAAYFYQGLSSLNFNMWSFYGTITHNLNRFFSVALQGGWNGTQYQTGQSFQSPLVDLNIGYTARQLSFGINAGEFEINEASMGIEMGPANVKQALGYLTYYISQKTYLTVSTGYQNYTFFAPASYANSFFQSLQNNINYSGTLLSQTGGVYWRSRPWLLTGILYNRYSFLSNVPNSSVTDNQLIAMVSIQLPF